MGMCPYCRSEYIFFSKKRGCYLCEECGERFDEPLTERSAMRLFFSYGHDKNSVIVELIKAELEKRGHQVWIDKSEIRSGNDWREKITKGILDSDRVISFMSQHSVRRPGVCLDELRIALCVRGADIRTVLLESEGQVNPPASLSSRQWLDMSMWEEKYAQGGEAWYNWFREQMDALCASIESAEAEGFAGEIGQLQKLLHPVLYDARELNLVSREFSGREWLRKDMEQWLQDPKANKVFCIFGVPGAGKSTFLANLMHYDPDVLAAVFFEWDESRRDSAEAVIRSIAFQIAAKVPDYRKQLLYVLNQVRNLDKYNRHELFRLLLTEPLNSCIDGGRQNAMVVLDALDEAEAGLPAFLAEKIYDLPGWVRIVVTSRDEPSVRAALPDARKTVLDADQPDNNRDIEAYIKARLPELNYAAVSAAAARAEGSFLYAVYFCDGVQTGDIDPKDMDTMPAGLGRFYARNFTRIFSDPVEYEIMMPILSLLACRESLPREVVCGALGLSQPEYMGLRRKLGAFIRMTRVTYRYSNTPQFMLKFSHKSLRDWLTDPERSDSYCLDLHMGREILARYALERVSRDRKWKAKPRHYVGECPKMDLDLELDYLQTNLAGILQDAGMHREFEAFLLEEETPWLPYMYGLNGFPDYYPMARLLEKLRDAFAALNEQLSRCERRNTPQYSVLYDVLKSVLGRSGAAELFFEQLRERKLDAYFRSAASDQYDYKGLPNLFNGDKIDITVAILRSLEVCREKEVPIPEDVAQMAERLKLSCMYIEGECGDPETVYANFGFLFRGGICILDDDEAAGEFNFRDVAALRKAYNTICLEEYLKTSFGDDAYVVALIRAGADLKKAAQAATKYLEQRGKEGWTSGTGYLVNTTMGASLNRQNYIQQVLNRHAPRKRWHPEAPDLIRNMGAMFDYCELYRFPCCGKAVMTGDGPPSQFRPDGCEDCE